MVGKPVEKILESLMSCCGPRTVVQPKATKPFATLFKALGDETRLEILGLLSAKKGSMCVCDIEAHFDLSQPTVSHHLRILRDAGLVTVERKGTWMYYEVNQNVLGLVRDFWKLIAG